LKIINKKKSRSLGAKMDVDVVRLNYLTGSPGDRNTISPSIPPSLPPLTKYIARYPEPLHSESLWCHVWSPHSWSYWIQHGGF